MSLSHYIHTNKHLDKHVRIPVGGYLDIHTLIPEYMFAPFSSALFCQIVLDKHFLSRIIQA